MYHGPGLINMAHLGDVKYGQPAWNLEGSEPSKKDLAFEIAQK